MSDQHLDDDALSAYLDGGEPWLGAHVEGCAACAARVAVLRGVSAAVGAPVRRPPAGRRDAAVARALDAGARGGGLGRSAGTWVAAIAAALVVVVGAAVGLSQLSSDRSDLRATSGAIKQTGPAAEADAPLAAVPSLGDLGALDDSADLRAAVEPTLAQYAFGRAEPSTDANRAAKSAAPGPDGAAQAAGATATPGCARAAQALDPANVRPAATATARWQGTQAQVLVYEAGGRPGAARVYVLARSDCRVLEFQSYAP